MTTRGHDHSSSSAPTYHGGFPATRWSLVASVKEKGEREMRALEELCVAYWSPLYTFARRTGSSTHNAADLVQGYFLKVVEKDYFSDADQERGKLRTFLLASFKNYIANERDRESAMKRGGTERNIVSIDADDAESECGQALSLETPETAFDRQWALTVLRAAVAQLREEYENANRGDVFQALRPFLSWNEGENSYGEVAKDLGVTENTIKSGVFRLRKRYRRCLRNIVADTLDTESETEIDAELQDLMAALS